MKQCLLFCLVAGVLALGAASVASRAAAAPELVVQNRPAQGALAFNPDGTWLATGRAVWDVQSGKMLRYFAGRMTEDTFDVAFDKTGQWFAAAGVPHCLEVWDASSGEEKFFFDDFKEDATALEFAPNRSALAGVDAGGALALYDLDTGKLLWKSAAHAFGATALAFSPDGKIIATAGYAQKAPPEASSDNWKIRDSAKRAREIKLWDAATGRALSTYALEPRLDSVRLFFHPNGKMLVAQTPDSVALALNNGKLSPENLEGLERIEAISDDGRLIAHWVSTPDTLGQSEIRIWLGQSEIRIWDTQQKKDVQALPTGAHRALFSPRAQSIAIDFGEFGAGAVYLYDSASGQEERRFSGQIQTLAQCALGASGAILATVHNWSWDGGRFIQLWNGRNGQELFRLTDTQKAITALALSHDEKLVLAATDNDDPKTAPGGNKIFVWNTADGKLQTSFVAETEALGGDKIQALALSPDGSTLAIGTWSLGEDFSPNAAGEKDDTYQISLWDLASHKLLKILSGHKARITDLVFSPDGKSLWSASDDETIRAWDVASGTEKWKLLARDAKSSKFSSPDETHLALSPDGRTLAAGLNRGTIKLYDAASGQEKLTLSGHETGVLDLCFAPDGKTLYSSGWDARLRAWDVASGEQEREQETDYWKVLRVTPENRLIAASYYGQLSWRSAEDGQLIATLAPTLNGGVVVTPDGFYQASRTALDTVAFRVGARAYGFEQFDLYFNQPARVLRAFGNADQTLLAAYQEAYEKRLRKMGVALSKGASAAPPTGVPEVTLDVLSLAATTDKATVTLPFHARAASADSSLKRVLVWVNNVPSRFRIEDTQAGSDGFDLPGAPREYSGAVEVELSSLDGGRNKIEIAVQSSDGVESRRETFEVTYKAPLKFPDLYVAVVGVSQYADADYNLNYAAKDADDLAKLWEGQAEKWNEVHMRRLLNADATRANILQLREFLAASQPDDEVVVFIAGHGLLDDKQDYYFATHDTDFKNPAKTGLSYDALESLLEGIGARRKLLMMDTCHAGEVDKDDLAMVGATTTGDGTVKGARGVRVIAAPQSHAAKTSSALLPELFADLRRGSGAEVIAASGGLEFSLESEQWKNGVFTFSVLEGLKTRHADADKNGHITVSELRDYVAAKVLELTRGRQKPVARQENLDSDFVVF